MQEHGILTLVETLASYVPALVLRRFAADPTPLRGPEREQFPAAVLFADISGFTALTERLAQRGPAGAEALTVLLNAYFERLIALVIAHGGDVVNLAGDAVVALWPTTEAEGLSEVTHRAAQCALDVQTTLHDYATAEDVRLSLQVGMGAGNVLALHVGGIYARWDLLIAGEPLAQMRAAERQARPGEVVLSAEAWELVREDSVGDALPDGGTRLRALRRPYPLHAAALPTISPEIEALLRAYLPAELCARIEADQTGWMAELRRVTVLFINFPDLHHNLPDLLEQTQAVMQTLQTLLLRYEGSINKLSVDWEGITLMAALGLPPLAHEDDALRAVHTAQAIQEALDEMDMRCAIGIATGRAFCGAVGSARRLEYTMIGDVVNVAARLMESASDQIFCDTTTYEAARMRLRFAALPPRTIRGKADPVAVYCPQGRQQGTSRPPPMVGREAERTALSARLEALRAGSGGVVIVEGEAGIGKSRLMADLREQARALRVTRLGGAGDAIEKATPYHAWRPIFNRLLNLDGVVDAGARRAVVLSQLHAEPERLRLAPLLNSVLSLDLPSNELIEQMTGSVRVDNTHDLLLHLLQSAVRRAPTLLILEDAHWLDSASYTLALLVSQRVHPLLLVLTLRPMTEPLSADGRALLQAPGTQRLALAALPPESLESLACRQLQVEALPEPIATLIHQKAQGNPFFCEELTESLREDGLLLIANGRCRVAPNVDLNAVTFPDNVQGVLTGRIDRLTPAQQLTVKAASVIGLVFPYQILRDIYPMDAERAQLPDTLYALVQLSILSVQMPDPELAYIFKHILLQEVAYNLMLFAQRRQLHRAVAEWYERAHAEDLSPVYALLAHHWSRADDEAQAIAYLEKAGAQALENGAYQEAIGFLSEAKALTARRPSGLSHSEARLRQARWERQLGDAHLGLGHRSESRRHLERAVALLGYPVPTAKRGLAVGLVGQALRQGLHLLRPARSARRSETARAAANEAARAYERLAEIHYISNETLPLVHAVLRTGNLAAMVGLSPELARAYGTLCLAAGLAPLHRMAEAYGRRAYETAQQVGQLAALAWVLEVTGIYHTGVGQWERAREALDSAIELFERLEDRSHWGECMAISGELSYNRGEFARCARLYTDLYVQARQNDNTQAQVWGLLGQTQAALALGRDEEARRYLEEAIRLTVTTPTDILDLPSGIVTHAFLALAHLRGGASAAARQEAETAAQLIAQASPSSIAALEGYAGVAEVTLALWEAELSNMSPMAREAQQACAALCKFARVFPIARPRAWLRQGLRHWLAGRPRKARKAWQRSLHFAGRLDMPYEQALAHYEIGRHLPLMDPARLDHLRRAVDLFTRLDTRDRLAHAQTALEAES